MTPSDLASCTIIGIELTDMLFGVATNSIGLMTGIMGLGPDLQAGFDIPANVTNAIVMNQMVAQGKINSRAYSITLTDATSDAGKLLSAMLPPYHDMMGC